jgi:hypothetical protein
MAKGLRARITYANVVATLALFIALGGTSMAAIQLGKNTVKAKQIAPGAVGTSEVKNGSLKAGDLAKGTLPLPQSGLRNLVVREFSGTVPGTCTETGIPPTVFYFCTPNEPSVTVACQAGEVPVYAANGVPEPAGSAPTGFKIPVIAPPGTAAGPTTIPVNSTLICGSP